MAGVDAEDAGGATAAGADPVPAGGRRRPRRRARGVWRAAIDDYQSPPRPAADARGPRAAPPAARPPAGHGPGALLGRGRDGDGDGGRVRLGDRPRGAVVPRDAVRPARAPGATASAQALMDRAQAGTATSTPAGRPCPGPDDALDSGIHTWGMCTDAVQPISNGLYARRGMVPRIPVWRLFGEVRRWSAAARRCRAVARGGRRSRPVAATGPDGAATPRRRSSTSLDRELIGAAHPADHAFLRREGRVGFLVRERGDGRGPRLRVRLGRRAAGTGRRPRPGAPPDADRASPCARRRCSARSRCGCPGTADRRDAGAARRRAAARRLPGARVLVAPRPPVRALPPDLARPRLSACRPRSDRRTGASLRGTWLPRTCPRSESSPRSAAEPAHDR